MMLLFLMIFSVQIFRCFTIIKKYGETKLNKVKISKQSHNINKFKELVVMLIFGSSSFFLQIQVP